MRLRLWPVMAVCLFPVIALGSLPGGEEFEALCRQLQWQEGALLLLAEPDKDIRQWLWQPMDDKGNTPIHICAKKGNPGLLLQLLSRVQPENRSPLVGVTNKYGNTPLHQAAFHGHLPVVECLLAEGASVTAVNYHDDTPLHEAATLFSYHPVVECLLAGGASVTAVNDNNDTPLHLAALHGHLSVVQCLLAQGASVTAVNSFDDTPLHEAAINGYLSVVQYLLAQGASVTVVNQVGETPLHLAARHNHLSVVQYLLARGASVTAVNKRGSTPLKLAAKRNLQQVTALLTYPPEPDFSPGCLQSLASFALWRETGRIDRLRRFAQAGNLPPLQVTVLLSILFSALDFSR